MNKSSLGFLSSIAGAIISFCQTFIRSMGVVEDAVGMAEASVKVARKKQSVDLEIDMIDYSQRRINEATMRMAKAEEAMKEYVSDDEGRKALVEKSRSYITERVNRKLSELEANVE